MSVPETIEERFALILEHVQTIEKKNLSFPIIFDTASLVAVIALIQLSLRHPGNNGEAATLGRGLVDGMIDRLDKQSPGIGELLKMGYDPSFDVPSGPIQ